MNNICPFHKRELGLDNCCLECGGNPFEKFTPTEFLAIKVIEFVNPFNTMEKYKIVKFEDALLSMKFIKKEGD